MGLGNRVAWAAFGASCISALAIALRAPKLPVSPAASAESRKALFSNLAADEASMRRTAAKAFPTDPWSQDDDFHNQELRRVQASASGQLVSVESLLLGLGDGMREGWPKPPSARMRATVPPCRPRPIY